MYYFHLQERYNHVLGGDPLYCPVPQRSLMKNDEPKQPDYSSLHSSLQSYILDMSLCFISLLCFRACLSGFFTCAMVGIFPDGLVI